MILTDHVRSARVAGMQPDDQFGPVLRRVRVERGLTQERLAEASGLHRTEISLLERSQRKPLLETVVALSRGLGVTPAELLHEVKI
jgi:transcriptional regulator with XRE-family HTH domain